MQSDCRLCAKSGHQVTIRSAPSAKLELVLNLKTAKVRGADVLGEPYYPAGARAY
jgi:hypothetical protein